MICNRKYTVQTDIGLLLTYSDKIKYNFHITCLEHFVKKALLVMMILVQLLQHILRNTD